MPAIPDDDAPPPAATAHRLGEDLGSLSLDELAHRISLLKLEIRRLETAMAAKSAQRSAADRIFGGR